MSTIEGLRPVERRVLRLAGEGMDDVEIGRRFGRSEQWTAQVRKLADLDRPLSPPTDGGTLRPLERRILRWLAEGADLDELSLRFRRSPEHLARVEEYARYKLAAAS